MIGFRIWATSNTSFVSRPRETSVDAVDVRSRAGRVPWPKRMVTIATTRQRRDPNGQWSARSKYLQAEHRGSAALDYRARLGVPRRQARAGLPPLRRDGLRERLHRGEVQVLPYRLQAQSGQSSRVPCALAKICFTHGEQLGAVYLTAKVRPNTSSYGRANRKRREPGSTRCRSARARFPRKAAFLDDGGSRKLISPAHCPAQEIGADIAPAAPCTAADETKQMVRHMKALEDWKQHLRILSRG